MSEIATINRFWSRAAGAVLGLWFVIWLAVVLFSDWGQQS